MPQLKKYRDWRGWLDGLRSKSMQAFGTALVTFLTTNGIAGLGIDALKDIGLDWRQGLLQCAVHAAIAAGKYVQDKPDPDLVDDEDLAAVAARAKEKFKDPIV